MKREEMIRYLEKEAASLVSEDYVRQTQLNGFKEELQSLPDADLRKMYRLWKEAP